MTPDSASLVYRDETQAILSAVPDFLRPRVAAFWGRIREDLCQQQDNTACISTQNRILLKQVQQLQESNQQLISASHRHQQEHLIAVQDLGNQLQQACAQQQQQLQLTTMQPMARPPSSSSVNALRDLLDIRVQDEALRAETSSNVIEAIWGLDPI